MPYLMDVGGRVDDLVNAAIYLIDTQGIESFTIRKIAAVVRISPSSIVSHLDNKRRMTDLFTKLIARRLERAFESGVRRRGVVALVPDDEALPVVRAWLAMCELARADDELGASVAVIEEHQRDLVQWGCRLAPDEVATVDAVQALVVGLWTARCARSDPMSAERADAVLRHACAALGVPTHGTA